MKRLGFWQESLVNHLREKICESVSSGSVWHAGQCYVSPVRAKSRVPSFWFCPLLWCVSLSSKQLASECHCGCGCRKYRQSDASFCGRSPGCSYQLCRIGQAAG